MDMTFSDEPADVLKLLAKQKLRLIIAESCTGGRIAAELVAVPGASEWFCGSAVTYREETKKAWLGVLADSLTRYSAVSEVVAQEMVCGVLAMTPEADLAVAVTGHLGPDAPVEQDGILFVAIARRGNDGCQIPRHQLAAQSRSERQREAAKSVLRLLIERLTM